MQNRENYTKSKEW